MKNIRKVVFIMTDTQRKDMVGCYGHPQMKTPYIDALAAEGIRFDRAYSAQPVCQPAKSDFIYRPLSTFYWGMD